MRKILFIIAAGASATVFLFAIWLREGVSSAEWAIELVGGYKNIERNYPALPNDVLFLQSLNHNPEFDQIKSTLSSNSCAAPDGTCLDTNLAIANVLAITSEEFPTAKKLIKIYSNTSSEKCPLKVEIAQLVYETSYLANNPSKDAANLLIEKIQQHGGLIHSINNAKCNAYLSERPYFAKAYLFYLATLISMSNSSPDSGWIYLLYESGYKI